MDNRIGKNYLHLLWRVPGVILWILLMPSLFFIARLLRLPAYVEIPHYFHRGLQLILGLQVSFTGQQSSTKPTLFVSNHTSYLDVFVLGGVRAFFIAKSEVASWPILGPLARFQNTLFFERASAKARHQLDVMQAHLSQGKNLILFPEGTSTEGAHVEPFKSSLFEAANLENSTVSVAIQPITIAYTHQAGRKMNQAMRDHYAWYAKMPFGPHFAQLFVLQKVAVKVHFHPVCYLEQFESRKQCAEHCQIQVATTLNQFIS